MTQTTRRAPGASRVGAAGVAVTVAGAVTNGLAYLVPVLGARQLTRGDLSILATLLALGAIAGMAGTALQLAVAVHRARHGAAPVRTATALTVAAIVCVLVVGVPVAAAVLRLPAAATALVAATTVAVVLAGHPLGELQGDQRFLRLAAGMAALAAGRYGGVVVGLTAGWGLTGSLAAGAVTTWLALPALAVLARGRPAAWPDGPVLPVRTVLTAGSAALAMLVVSYVDLILARRYLPPDVSGAYAVGTVLTKGALWAPQVVTVIALPRLARGDRRTLVAALLLVGGCGAVLVTASALAGGLAFRLAGGADFTYLAGYAPVFAATGALYALLFVLVNAQVAAGGRWPSAPLWVATAALVAAVQFAVPATLAGVALSALVTAAVTVAVTGMMVFRRPGGAG